MDKDAPRGRANKARRPLLCALRMAWASTRWLLAGALATQVAAALAPAVQLALVRALVDGVVEGRPRAQVISVVSLLVGVVVAQRLAGLANSSLLTLARDHSSADAVSQYLETAARLDAGHLNDSGFHDRMRHAGEVASDRFSSVVFGLVGLVGAVVGMAGLSALLLSISPAVAGLVLASMVPWISAQRRGFAIVREVRATLLSRRRQQAYLRGLVTDPDSALELLAAGAGEAIVARHRALSDEVLILERPAHVRQFFLIAIGTVVGGLLLIAAFLVAALAAFRGDASPGDVAAAVAGLSAFLMVTGNLANSMSGLLQHGPYLDDYFDFLATPPLLEVPAVPAGIPASLGEGVVVDDVTFTYPGAAAPALAGVSLTLRPGELVALVGENGAGKSTLVKLLLRFFDPDAGRISVAGVDLRSCAPLEIRSRTAVVFQDFARYQFDVRDVVRLGRTAARPDDQRVWAALCSAGLDQFIVGLPSGLDTQLGPLFPGGRDLSGGQWQRLALARLFYRGADILVLDEPTSSIDPDSEAATFARLKSELGQRIGIVSSHRFSTVRTADRIAVLHEGRLIESGTHDELLAEGGRYANLFHRQAAAYR
ncbi:MAG: ABC transporter ATP-binding protein [Acidimicrobiales bacterium]